MTTDPGVPVTAGREQDARETLRAEVRALIRDAIEECLVDPAYRDADVEMEGLLREIAALPSPPATTGAGRVVDPNVCDNPACPNADEQWSHNYGAGCVTQDDDPASSPPATDGAGCDCDSCAGHAVGYAGWCPSCRHRWPERLAASPPPATCSGCSQSLRVDARGLNTCDTAECPGNIAAPPATDGDAAARPAPDEGPGWFWTQAEWADWSNDLAGSVPEDYEDDVAQEAIIGRFVRDAGRAFAADPERWWAALAGATETGTPGPAAGGGDDE